MKRYLAVLGMVGAFTLLTAGINDRFSETGVQDDVMGFVEVTAPTGNPTANRGWLYVKDNSGTSDLYFEGDDGTVTDLTSVAGLTASLTFEGATADAYETVITVTDPTAYDQTWTLPNLGSVLSGDITGGFVLSTLATNGPGMANAVTGGTSQLIFEGSAADAHEAIIQATNPTADTIWLLPVAAADSFAIMGSTLETNAAEIANSVWGASNALVFEGATADDYETSITPTDATADRSIVLPNYSMQIGVGEVVAATNVITAAECGKTFYLNHATEFASTLPTVSTVGAGCKMRFVVTGAASGANYTILTGNSLENKIYGIIDVNSTMVACADEDTITLVDGNAVGDWVEVTSDATAWYITGQCLTAAKMTCTQAD